MRNAKQQIDRNKPPAKRQRTSYIEPRNQTCNRMDTKNDSLENVGHLYVTWSSGGWPPTSQQLVN